MPTPPLDREWPGGRSAGVVTVYSTIQTARGWDGWVLRAEWGGGRGTAVGRRRAACDRPHKRRLPLVFRVPVQEAGRRGRDGAATRRGSRHPQNVDPRCRSIPPAPPAGIAAVRPSWPHRPVAPPPLAARHASHRRRLSSETRRHTRAWWRAVADSGDDPSPPRRQQPRREGQGGRVRRPVTISRRRLPLGTLRGGGPGRDESAEGRGGRGAGGSRARSPRPRCLDSYILDHPILPAAALPRPIDAAARPWTPRHVQFSLAGRPPPPPNSPCWRPRPARSPASPHPTGCCCWHDRRGARAPPPRCGA